jgi:hypothetical protein
MKRDSRDILKSILICINGCLEIIGKPRLEDGQSAVIIAVLENMAVRTKRNEVSFNKRLAEVFRMSPGADRRQALLRLLGLEA